MNPLVTHLHLLAITIPTLVLIGCLCSQVKCLKKGFSDEIWHFSRPIYPPKRFLLKNNLVLHIKNCLKLFKYPNVFGTSVWERAKPEHPKKEVRSKICPSLP